MDFPLKYIQELLKLTPSKLVAIIISLILFLSVPDQWLQNIGVLNFKQQYSYIFSIALLLTTTLLIIQICQGIGKWLKNRFQNMKARKKILQRLQLLTEDEKQILRYYIFKETRTNYLDIRSGTVNGLVAAGIIYRASNASMTIGFNCMIFAHNIRQTAWQILNENERLIFENESPLYFTDFDHMDPNRNDPFL